MQVLALILSFLSLLRHTTDTLPLPSQRVQPVNIYLTIDDGPSSNSAAISQMVSQARAKVNVFLVGSNADSCGTLAKEVYNSNPFIESGNHSYSHAQGHYRKYYQHPHLVVADFARNETKWQFSHHLARLPGRNTWRLNGRKRTDLPDANRAADTLKELGYQLMGWDLEWTYQRDGYLHIQSAKSVALEIENLAISQCTFSPGHIVILCHEVMFTSAVNRLHFLELLTTIKQTPNYQLAWLSEYPDLKSSTH